MDNSALIYADALHARRSRSFRADEAVPADNYDDDNMRRSNRADPESSHFKKPVIPASARDLHVGGRGAI